jgi:hypothetical protein
MTALAVAMHQPQPHYRGQSLEVWLASTYSRQDQEASELSINAIRAIGTNAVPTLLHWISYERPSWLERLVTNAPPFLVKPLNYLSGAGKLQRAIDARNAFTILGTSGVSAIPRLQELALTSRDANCARRCVAALTEDTAAPRAAAWALGGLRLSPDRTVPALASALDSSDPNLQNIALALLNFGTHTQSALSQLQHALANEPDPLGPIHQALSQLTNYSSIHEQ